MNDIDPLAPKAWAGLVCGRTRAMLGDADPAWPLGSTSKCLCCSWPTCRAIVCMAGAGQQEEIEALPVEEQAAILCSLATSNDNVPMEYGSPVDEIVRAVYFAVPCMCGPRHAMSDEGVRDEWAESEARIREGLVR